jgi:hypothetical protein
MNRCCFHRRIPKIWGYIFLCLFDAWLYIRKKKKKKEEEGSSVGIGSC